MRLWSLQSPDFSLTAGRVDHEKSEYWRTIQRYPEACCKLWPLIGVPDGQVIWCLTSKDWLLKRGICQILWELEVPDREIIAFVDDIVWNRILRIKCCLPEDLRTRLCHEAINKFPNNTEEQDAYLEKRKDEFWSQGPPTGDWWDSLLIDPQTGECVSAIIKHPACQEWVLKKEIWQCPTNG